MIILEHYAVKLNYPKQDFSFYTKHFLQRSIRPSIFIQLNRYQYVHILHPNNSHTPYVASFTYYTVRLHHLDSMSLRIPREKLQISFHYLKMIFSVHVVTCASIYNSNTSTFLSLFRPYRQMYEYVPNPGMRSCHTFVLCTVHTTYNAFHKTYHVQHSMQLFKTKTMGPKYHASQ